MNGGLVGSDALLLAFLSDENGLTLSQAGLGHEMLLSLDNDPSQRYVLNAYYQSDLDTYQSGQIRFWLRNLAPGPHQLTLQVWDTHNNSAQARLDFVVVGKEELVIQELYNFPNPVQVATTFQFWHNQSAEALPVQLRIFDTQGKQVAQIDGFTQKGQNTATLTWNGADSRGHRLANGLYIYQVQMSSPVSGKVGRARGKLIVLH
ncbi:MAG: T9SS type A sorting domain-containing protein [Microscillaceae bacterium]|nr:T9SS type A sorting domain-containing protein [Microscillaceae bacterium]